MVRAVKLRHCRTVAKRAALFLWDKEGGLSERGNTAKRDCAGAKRSFGPAEFLFALFCAAHAPLQTDQGGMEVKQDPEASACIQMPSPDCPVRDSQTCDRLNAVCTPRLTAAFTERQSDSHAPSIKGSLSPSDRPEQQARTPEALMLTDGSASALPAQVPGSPLLKPPQTGAPGTVGALHAYANGCEPPAAAHPQLGRQHGSLLCRTPPSRGKCIGLPWGTEIPDAPESFPTWGLPAGRRSDPASGVAGQGLMSAGRTWAFTASNLNGQLERAQHNRDFTDIDVLDNGSGDLDDLFSRIGYVFQHPALVQCLAFVAIPRQDRHRVNIYGNECLDRLGQKVLVPALSALMSDRYHDLANPTAHATYAVVSPRLFRWSIQLGLPAYAIFPSQRHEDGLKQPEICSLITSLLGAAELDGGIAAVRQILSAILDWPEADEADKRFKCDTDLFDIGYRARCRLEPHGGN
ncbi:hypothetical protein WJX73_000361 [Symbiochloris irregularis]|uniref:Uncharacterized protein n=1 Tax=Symbiochloris irregularis TaxID=706552 RepID=A0AAW1PEP6_9CHLO